MSGPKLTLTDVRRTETAIHLTTRDHADGIIQTNAFGINGNKEGLPFELVRISYSLDALDDPTLVWLTCRDSKGEDRTLWLQVEDTGRVLPMFAPLRYNTFTGVRYADDHVTVEFIRVDGVPDTFTFGVVDDRYEYTLTTLIATVHGDDEGFPLRSYEVIDRAGEKHVFEVLIPADMLNDFEADHHAYFAPIKEQRRPKSKAAALPHTLQQAA